MLSTTSDKSYVKSVGKRKINEKEKKRKAVCMCVSMSTSLYFCSCSLSLWLLWVTSVLYYWVHINFPIIHYFYPSVLFAGWGSQYSFTPSQNS